MKVALPQEGHEDLIQRSFGSSDIDRGGLLSVATFLVLDSEICVIFSSEPARPIKENNRMTRKTLVEIYPLRVLVSVDVTV